MSQYLPKPYGCSSGNVKGELDLSNYAMKADLKRATSVETYNLASKFKMGLSCLKAEADKMG